VELPLIYSSIKRSEKERKAIALKAIESVGLDHRANFFSNQLSGGEKQRVAIARALVNNPSVILADEPTGNLDSVSGIQVLMILQQLHRDGKTIILVTHENGTAEHAERIIHMKDGHIDNDIKVLTRRFAKLGTDIK
jgi:putative ABC transport system ATP-binding protein